jgi:anti-anti-sigma regulatory factor
MCSSKLKEADGELRLAGAEGHVKAILETTGVDKIVALYSNKAKALKGFAGRAD